MPDPYTLVRTMGYHPPDVARHGASTRPTVVDLRPARFPSPAADHRPRRRIPPRGAFEAHHEQANVSAQEAAPGQGARLPRADEDPGRSAHPGRPSCQRAQEALRLTTADQSPASEPLEMLRSVKDFAALQSGGRSRAHPLLILRWRRNGGERLRFGFSTSRKVGNAVVRNRLRRRLREALRATGHRPAGGWDILVICRPASAAAGYADLTSALDRLLERVGKDEGGMKKT